LTLMVNLCPYFLPIKACCKGKGCEIGKGLIAGEGYLAKTRQGGQKCVLSQQRQGSNFHKGNIKFWQRVILNT
jgi:hypothetical protein